jgi:hypothetical protein
MKTLLIFTLCFLVTSQIFSQVQSSCEVPNVLKEYYDLDVKHLALTRLYETNSPDTNLIEIPQIHQDTIWEGLAAIFNLPNIYDRDSVFDKFCIHIPDVWYNKINKRILVSIDPSYEWTIPWQNLQTTTGITDLDNFLAKYGFTVYDYFAYNTTFNWVYLSTNQNLNVLPICDSIAKFTGVKSVGGVSDAGDGNFIEYKLIDNSRFYDFSINWGDCPSGCINYHLWKYKVDFNCNVEFLGEFDHIYSPESYPTPVNCNITTNISDLQNSDYSIEIFPNPISNITTFKTNKMEVIEYKIFDCLGNIISTDNFIEQTNLNLENLNSGIYFIQLKNQKNKTETHKLIKK